MCKSDTGREHHTTTAKRIPSYKVFVLAVAALCAACLLYSPTCWSEFCFNIGMIELTKGLQNPTEREVHLDAAEVNLERASTLGERSGRLEGAYALAGLIQGTPIHADRLLLDDPLLSTGRGGVSRRAAAFLAWRTGERVLAVDLWAKAGDMDSVRKHASGLMRTYRDSEQLNDALFWFEKLYPLFPEDVYMGTYGADILWDLGKHSDAIDLLERTVRIRSDSAGASDRAHAWHTLCRRYQNTGHGQDAVAACRQSIAAEPGFVYTYETLSKLLLQLDRPYEAEEVFHSAKGKLDHQMYLLGDIYRKTGRYEMAGEVYCKALALLPGQERVEYIQQQLTALDGRCPK